MATSADAGLIPLFTTQFSTNLELLLQQMGSKLRGKTREGFHVGKMASPINQVGAISAKPPAGRFVPKNRTDAEFVRRWVFPQEVELDQLIDSFDELQTIVDPKSQYVENAANAIGRAWDDAIIASANYQTAAICSPQMIGFFDRTTSRCISPTAICMLWLIHPSASYRTSRRAALLRSRRSTIRTPRRKLA